MKDFYDINIIAHTMVLDGAILSRAIKATFECRKTELASKPLYIFMDEFKQEKQVQWHAFLVKNSLAAGKDKNTIAFSEAVNDIQLFLEPVYLSIFEQQLFQKQWSFEKFNWS